MGAGPALDVCVWRAAGAGAGVVCALHDLAQHREFSLASALEPVEARLGEEVAGKENNAEWESGESWIRSCVYIALREQSKPRWLTKYWDNVELWAVECVTTPANRPTLEMPRRL